MASELQRLVDSLGRRLGRSVALDDPQLNLLAYSAHNGPVDEVRTESILRRAVAREMVDHIYEQGAAKSHDLFTVSTRPELGMRIERVGMPVHHQERLLGFLWLLASEGSIGPDERESLRQAAETVGLIMHREYLVGELNRGRERELTRDLLAGSADVRAEAADQLLTEGLFSAGSLICVVVALSRPDAALTEQDRIAMSGGATFVRHRFPQRHVLTLERPDHTIALIAQSGRAGQLAVAEIGIALRDQVLAETKSDVLCYVGAGKPHPLRDAHVSYTEARRAVDVGRIVRVLGPVVSYSELGVYGMLAELPSDRLRESLHPGLRALLSSPADPGGTLVTTLDLYLDNTGDAQATAVQLRIHRTSLYHRLRRIEKITGLNLSVGDERLALHLGLKIARLIDMR